MDAFYYDSLSDASKKSLEFQGGPFQGHDLEEFEHNPLKEEMLRLRKWDDLSKVIGITSQTPRASSYREMIRRHIEQQQKLSALV